MKLNLLVCIQHFSKKRVQVDLKFHCPDGIFSNIFLIEAPGQAGVPRISTVAVGISEISDKLMAVRLTSHLQSDTNVYVVL